MAIILEPEEHAARIPNRFAVAVWAIAVLALAGLAAVARQHPATAPGEDAEHAIVFVCRNGVAMSVWSALSFDRLAAQRGLSVRAASRASTPSFREVPLRMRLALALDGFRVGDYQPRVISAEDVRRAERVILIDTELPPSASVPGAAPETWSGFPPMREEYFASRAALQTRVEELVSRLAAAAAGSR
jgi:hypothetical protein